LISLAGAAPIGQVCPVQQTDSPVEADGDVGWAVPFTASSVPPLRAIVTRLLSTLGVDPGVIETARTVVSELVTNAMLHATPCQDGRLHVVMSIDTDTIAVSVSDGGSVTIPQLMRPPPMSQNGRGLDIVRALSREWGVREADDGNTVFAVVRR
jgi:serine/threonine-protein kinase RsbW